MNNLVFLYEETYLRGRYIHGKYIYIKEHIHRQIHIWKTPILGRDIHIKRHTHVRNIHTKEYSHKRTHI